MREERSPLKEATDYHKLGYPFESSTPNMLAGMAGLSKANLEESSPTGAAGLRVWRRL